ncbi:MAG: hypothetical protein QOG43_2021 [Actinomycetota bacterium]|jgi:hypothetical protein|nr:hypothetical protein [Actinomycetota bacterium]
MADDQRTTEDELPGGGPYSPGPNKYTGGGTTVDDVSPLPDRSGAPAEEADDS